MTHACFYFHFDPVAVILNAIQKNKNQVLVSLDLNLTKNLWPIENNRLILDNDLFIDMNTLEAISRVKNKIFIFQDNALTPLEIRTHDYYKLVPTPTAPVLEINGIKMHRTKDIDPLTDAQKKTCQVVSKGDLVLDTCGGLGYSAAFAVKAGAKKVISTEKSSAVIRLRHLNPWSRKIRSDQLLFIHADITRYIDGIEDSRFDSVIHDPPRFTSQTGDLYGRKFYDTLFRVMAPRSKLFHYTGCPKKIQHQDRFVVNTVKRLQESGFSSVFFKKDLQGILAQKTDKILSKNTIE